MPIPIGMASGLHVAGTPITFTDRGGEIVTLNTDTTTASASFTVGAASALVVFVGWIGANTTPRTFSVTDTFANVGAWTSVERITAVGAGYSIALEAYWAVSSGSGSGVITATRSAGTIDQFYWIHVAEYAGGVNLTSPIGLNTSSNNGGGGTSHVHDLGATPASTSGLYGCFITDGDTAAPVGTPPTGWTELDDDAIAASAGRAVGHKLFDGAQTSTWTGLNTASVHVPGIILEIVEA